MRRRLIFPTADRCLLLVTVGTPSAGSSLHNGAGSLCATRTNDELQPPLAPAAETTRARRQSGDGEMDVSKYLGSTFLKVADVKVSGPIRVVIASIVEGKFDKPDLVFDDGTRLTLNVTNTRILARAYGK